MDFEEYVVPAIAVGVYLVFQMIKPLLGDKRKFIPLMAGVLGIMLNTWFSGGFSFEVFLTGLTSGLSATGIDQAVRLNEYKPVESDEE